MPIGPNGEKRPGDVIANAVHSCKVLVGDAKEKYKEISKKVAAARWGAQPSV